MKPERHSTLRSQSKNKSRQELYKMVNEVYLVSYIKINKKIHPDVPELSVNFHFFTKVKILAAVSA